MAKILGRAGTFHAGLGWEDFKGAHGTKGEDSKAERADIWPYLTDRWGWIGRPITAVALLFGAQFWFDVLRRLVGFRKGGSSSSAAAPAA